MEPDRLQSPALIEEIRSYLQQWFPDFGYRKPDDYFFAGLYVEFRDLDLLEEIKVFHAWCLDKDNEDMNYRISFRRWLRKAASYRTSRRT